MSTDADHQALDFNIGRILQMFLAAEIDIGVAKLDITKNFSSPQSEKLAIDLDSYLFRLLDQLRGGDLEASEVRLDLVRLGILANAHDEDFAKRIRQDADNRLA